MDADRGEQAGIPLGELQALPGRGNRAPGVDDARNGAFLVRIEQVFEQRISGEPETSGFGTGRLDRTRITVKGVVVLVCVGIENGGHTLILSAIHGKAPCRWRTGRVF